MDTRPRELSLFSGAGGGLLATQHLLGWRTVAYVEIDRYCQQVLQARIRDGLLDDAPIWDDVRTFDGRPWRGCVDIVTFGDPCQRDSNTRRYGREPVSLAGHALRIVSEIRPRGVLRENPAKVRKDAHWSADRISEALESLGYTAPHIEIRACCMGGDHRRARLFVPAWLANPHSEYVEKWPPHGSGAVQEAATTRRVVVENRKSDHARRDRATNDVASRMERLKSCGEGIVPIVAATAWRLLTE